MRTCSDQLIVCTNYGSYCHQTLVTETLKDCSNPKKGLSRALDIGPVIIMKFVAETTRLTRLQTLVGLNTTRFDGTGMWGGCRVLLDDGAQFVCGEGPEFDAYRVGWANLLERLSFYQAEEPMAVEIWQRNICNHDLAFEEARR